MKPLNCTTLKIVREIEKNKETYKPKEIWVRAWEIMVERSNQYVSKFLGDVKEEE